jgi:hypothetical protein
MSVMTPSTKKHNLDCCKSCMIRSDMTITYEIVGFANNIWNVAEFCELVNDRR